MFYETIRELEITMSTIYNQFYLFSYSDEHLALIFILLAHIFVVNSHNRHCLITYKYVYKASNA